MSLLDRLLGQLQQRGLSVGPGDEPGELKLYGPRSEATPELMRALKAFKPALLEKFGGAVRGQPETRPEPAPEPEPEADVEVCRVCGREVADEDKPRLADPLFCERGGGGKACVDGNGVAHPEALRCPYKPT